MFGPEQRVYSHPSSEVLIMKAATFSMSISERRPPKAGMAFFPFVTCVRTEASERPPARYWSRASFSRVFSGMMTFCPPAWHAAQLASKIFSPAPGSAAMAGKTATPKATAPAAAACCYENDIKREKHILSAKIVCVMVLYFVFYFVFDKNRGNAIS